jgi:hypothetical protein
MSQHLTSLAHGAKTKLYKHFRTAHGENGESYMNVEILCSIPNKTDPDSGNQLRSLESHYINQTNAKRSLNSALGCDKYDYLFKSKKRRMSTDDEQDEDDIADVTQQHCDFEDSVGHVEEEEEEEQEEEYDLYDLTQPNVNSDNDNDDEDEDEDDVQAETQHNFAEDVENEDEFDDFDDEDYGEDYNNGFDEFDDVDYGEDYNNGFDDGFNDDI